MPDTNVRTASTRGLLASPTHRLRTLLTPPAALLATLALTLAPSAAAQPTQPLPRWRVVTLQPSATQAPSSYAEPGIAIAPDGTAVVNAATANTGAPPTLWLSRDNANTWTRGRAFDPTASSTGDADAAIGSDGTLYALNLAYNATPPAQPTNPALLVYRSSDGTHWQGPAHFPPPHGIDQPDRPWLVVDPHNPANVDVVNSEGGGNIVIWHSTDHAATFDGPIPVTAGENSQAALALSSRPLFDPTDDRRIVMVYETASPAALVVPTTPAPPYEFPITQLWLAESLDAGTTWTNHLVLDTSALPDPALDGTAAHLLVASAIDPAGHLFAAFSLRPTSGTTTRIEVIHSVDHGATWSPPTAVKTATASNVMPALAATPGGHLDISWYASTAADFRDPGAHWAEMYAESADPLSTHPSFATSQVSGAQPVHIGAINTAGAVGADLGNNWGLRDFQSLTVDACGLPHPTWANDNGLHATQTAFLETPDPPPTCAESHNRHNPSTAAAALTALPNTAGADAGAAGGVVALLSLWAAATAARRRNAR